MHIHHLRTLTLIAGTMLLANVAEAQFLRGLQDRVKQSIEQRVEKNLEERVAGALEERAGAMVDQSFDAMFAGGTGAGGAGDQSAGLISRMFDTSNVVVADEYAFDIAATFEIQALDKRGRSSSDEDMEMTFYYSANAPYTGTRMVSGTQDGSAMIIYDFNNSVMLMLMESEGERFAIPYNWTALTEGMNNAWEATDEASGAESTALRFEPIGSRNISGYASDGYRVTNDTHVTELWVSNEVAPGIERIFQANRAIPLLGGSMPPGYPQGMLMELDSTDLKSGEKVVMTTSDIDTRADVSFVMSDYPMLNLGAIGAQ